MVETARLFALLNMAGADAYITCWQAKYRYHYWRPVTAIRSAGSAGNRGITPDPAWEPLLPTPAHPGYPSGHAAYAGATERVLQEFFGDKASFSLTDPAVNVTRTYHSLSHLWCCRTRARWLPDACELSRSLPPTVHQRLRREIRPCPSRFHAV
jgi:hypothetical protein